MLLASGVDTPVCTPLNHLFSPLPSGYAKRRAFLLNGSIWRTVQINLGQAVQPGLLHCHVDAGPKRTEIMAPRTAGLALELIRAAGARTVDLTGGAPELNPSFRFLVEQNRRDGRHVLDRCNLTVLFEPGQEDLAEFLAKHIKWKFLPACPATRKRMSRRNAATASMRNPFKPSAN